MLCDTARTAHVPLSQYTIKELRARAAELRSMAGTARTAADMQALEALGARFDALATKREAVEHQANVVAQFRQLTAIQRLETEYRAEDPDSDRPLGAPSAEAVVMAADAVSRHFVLPETRQHPVVRSATMKLAYLLMAYGLVPSKPAVAKPSGAETADMPNDARHHILLVDDAADVLVSVGAFLAHAGFAVERASSGDEALQLIARDRRIDVLVTDFAMPGLNGTELISQAKQLRPNLKALVITGYPNADGLAELPPRTKILCKPFRRDTLIAGVKSLLGEMQPVPSETTELIELPLSDHDER
jgi:CheY-like chemotaxis protein